MQELEDNLREATLHALSQIMAKGEEPPQALYHYTDEQGLMGILEGRSIRATHQEFLNDPSETEHARALALDFVTNRFRSTPTDLETFRQQVLGRALIGPNDFHVDAYVASFSTRCDSLSQWRAYANNGRGFCIGIHPRHEGFGQRLLSFDAGTVLWKVLYEETVFRERLSSFFDRGLELVEQATSVNVVRQAAINRLANWFQILVQLSRRVCKQGGYGEEAEWRLVHVRRRRNVPFETPDTDGILFRAAKGQIVPYVVLPITRGEALLPLDSIWLGPAAIEPERELALRMLLASKGYNPGGLLRRSATLYRA